MKEDAKKKKRKRSKKKENPARKVLKVIGGLFLTTGIVACFIVAGILSSFLVEALNFNIEDYQVNMASTIYMTDEQGNDVEYEQIHSETKRIWVNLSDIPKDMQDAAVAIEDQRFYSHHGVDIKRTLGAFFSFITKSDTYGGSTITQQVVKNLTNEREESPIRKIKEILRALVLETQLDKSEILEFYLNVAHFGEGANGVGAAANVYFDKDVSELNLAQCASIIGITQYPGRFNPFVNPEENKNKQEVVLAKMLELGYITQQEYDEAVAYQLDFVEKGAADDGEWLFSYFTEAVIDEVAVDLAEERNISEVAARKLIFNSGLKIYSTVESNVQDAMETVFEDSDNRNYFPKLAGEVQPEAAMVVIDPHTGAIVGMVGGVGEKEGNLVLNRATSLPRQPGSTIKPLLAYGPNIESERLTPGSILIDEPIDIAGWTPQNWYHTYYGPVTVREALVQSMNIPAVKAAQLTGVEELYDFAKNKLGFSTLVDNEEIDGQIYSDKNLSSLALGGLTKGVTVKDLTAAYMPFANGGKYIKPYTYTKVIDRNGKVILEKEIRSEQLYSEQTTYLMTSILMDVAKGPLGSSALISNSVSAGKTGTSNDDIDRWYVGYTPYYLGGVWYGYEKAKTVPYSATRIVAHKLWKAVMEEIHEDLPEKEFEEPAGITTATICKISGDRASGNCPAITEEFKVGTTPKKVCSAAHATTSSNPEEPSDSTPTPSATPTSSSEPQSTVQPEETAPASTPASTPPQTTPQEPVSTQEPRQPVSTEEPVT